MNRKALMILLSAAIVFSCVSMAGADLTTSLVAYYPFSGNADDATANHNNGAVSNATLTSDRFGNADSAYYFNGTNAYIQVPFQTYLDRNQAQGYTVAFWFRFDNNPGYVDILDKSHGWPSYNYMNWVIQISAADGSGTRTFGFGGGNGSAWLGAADSPIPQDAPQDAQWHHAAGTLLDQTFQFYVDGDLKSTSTFSGTVVDTVGDLFIGRHYNLGRYYQGGIDEIRLYQRALSGDEIAQLAGVPLPPALILFGSGLIGLVGLRRKFKIGA